MLTTEEKHILRQAYWFEELSKKGYSNIHLEKSFKSIRGKSKRRFVQVDVYAEKDGKVLIIEIGEIMNILKKRILKELATKGIISFIWEFEGFEGNRCKKREKSEYENFRNFFERIDLSGKTSVQP